MKRTTICYLAAIVLCTNGVAEAQTKQALNIEKATVFIKGAELVSTAKVSLAKGENEYIFSNVAGNINDKSIVVSATNGAAVASVTFQNNYTNTENVSPK